MALRLEQDRADGSRSCGFPFTRAGILEVAFGWEAVYIAPVRRMLPAQELHAVGRLG